MSTVCGTGGFFGRPAVPALPAGLAMHHPQLSREINAAGAAATPPSPVTDDKPPMTSPAAGPMAAGRITTRGSHE